MKYRYLNTPWRVEFNTEINMTGIFDCFNNLVLKGLWYKNYHRQHMIKMIIEANSGCDLFAIFPIKEKYMGCLLYEPEEHNDFDFLKELNKL